MIGLTEQQARLLKYIEDYAKDNGGMCPTYQEIMEWLGLRSKSGVHRIITALEERGRIRRKANRARALDIVHEDPKGLRAFPTVALVAELARRSEQNRRAA